MLLLLLLVIKFPSIPLLLIFSMKKINTFLAFFFHQKNTKNNRTRIIILLIDYTIIRLWKILIIPFSFHYYYGLLEIEKKEEIQLNSLKEFLSFKNVFFHFFDKYG